jgi:lysozyme family protein
MTQRPAQSNAQILAFAPRRGFQLFKRTVRFPTEYFTFIGSQIVREDCGIDVLKLHAFTISKDMQAVNTLTQLCS